MVVDRLCEYNTNYGVQFVVQSINRENCANGFSKKH